MACLWLAVYLDHGEISKSQCHGCFKTGSRVQVDAFHAARVVVAAAPMARSQRAANSVERVGKSSSIKTTIQAAR